MQEDDVPVIDPSEDLSQILPIQQKRTIAFINHFIMQTVSYLNNFAQSCESRFLEFEYKIEKIEASLLILESQLASIEGLDNLKIKEDTKVENANESINHLDLPEVPNKQNVEEIVEETKKEPLAPEEVGIKAKDDARYQKYFKMLHVGVPGPAVRLKMQNEGLDPNILDHPDHIIPGTVQEKES